MQIAPVQLSVRLSVILAAIATVFLLIGGPADAEAPPVPAVEYVVAQGDTLWGVASEHVDPGEDVRKMIEVIKSASGIQESGLFPGQILMIPQG